MTETFLNYKCNEVTLITDLVEYWSYMCVALKHLKVFLSILHHFLFFVLSHRTVQLQQVLIGSEEGLNCTRMMK